MTDLRKAAEAVLERWDSPAWEWKKQGPTADLMANLRTALAAEQPKPEPVAWFLPQPLEVHYYSAKNQALQREVEALRRDAERWRWHRAEIAKHMGRSPESIDASIDAAMKEGT